ATTETYTLSLHDALPIFDHEPTAEEIARLVDKPVNDVKRMLGLNERVASMDTPIGAGSDKSLLDTVADEGASDPADLLQDNNMCSCLRSEEHTSELQSRENLVCRLLREKK